MKKDQILIVDDDVIILKLLNFILSEEYTVVTKSNGIDAFSWLEEGNFPALVISDLLMPYLDGTSFVKNLKISGYYRDTPVIVLSGLDNLDEVITQMPFQVEGYFRKPFNPDALKAKISTILKAGNSHAAS
jgi:two-component system chemotaxis response regulator CheY